MKKRMRRFLPFKILFLITSFALILCGVLWDLIPPAGIRILLLLSGVFGFLFSLLREKQIKNEQADFANDICETIDSLINGRHPENYRPYEDSDISKVQNRLLKYYDQMQETKLASERDRQLIQELVSDISHQVKTPIANIRMFAGILEKPALPDEKRAEFLATMSAQINKLDFLLSSLIKMSRLEIGTFTLHMDNNNLFDTIAQAVGTVYSKAEQKNIRIDADCRSTIRIRHDAKWTAEALENILDNAVKYTPAGGNIRIHVRPWQFYTRIDITDTGIGIPSEHYNDIFQRFYRMQETACEEGVGLGLYLARSIVTLQKGYISVSSKVGKGSTFSVFFLN